MLNKLKAWLTNRSDNASFVDHHVLSAWARQQGAICRRVKPPQTGWVVEWPHGVGRLEWGASRRPYIVGRELRWRFPCENGLNTEMVVLSQSFAKRIDTELFGKLTADTHTTLESGLPDEVRWLAMWPARVVLQDTNGCFVCHSQDNAWAGVWKSPTAVSALEQARQDWWAAESAITLSCYRNTLVLRMSADFLDETNLNQVKYFLDRIRLAILE